MAHLSKLFFWFSIAGLFYTFPGYPLVMALLARQRGKRESRGNPAVLPSVTVVLVAHNEASRISARLENLCSSAYPSDRLEVVVVSDGSKDDTVKIASTYSDRGVRVLESPRKAGKASCLNRAAKEPKGEIVVFADARQRFSEDAIARLASWFSDPRIGAVSGCLFIEASGSSVGRGVDAYWRLERMLRDLEARFDSCVGCTGAIYAVRGELFEGIPEDTVLDDVVIPMIVTLKGYRVAFDRKACAFDPQALEPEKERGRKRRTLAGNLQMLFRYPGWLLPWRNRLWWQLISHKYLRLASPGFLIAMFISNLLIADEIAYRVLLAGQGIFYILGFVGLAQPAIKRAWLSIPSGFLFLNWMVIEAFWQFAFTPKRTWWGSHRAGDEDGLPTR